MDFDYTMVCTAFDADNVKAGDIVFIGYTAEDIYKKVAAAPARLACMVTEILPKNQKDRFVVTTSTGCKVYVPYVYILHSRSSAYYELAKALYEGKPVWINSDSDLPILLTDMNFKLKPECYMLADPNKLRMRKLSKGLYTFNYKGFECEVTECADDVRYVYFIKYWDSEPVIHMDVLDWAWDPQVDVGDNKEVPEFIIERLDAWIKDHPNCRGQ